MTSLQQSPLRRLAHCAAAFALCSAVLPGTLHAQPTPPAEKAPPATISALMLSDIHFDPFHDPAKAQQLIAAPETQWNAILSSPPSPDQPGAFARLQKACGARGIDTPYALLQSSLAAIKTNAPGVRFATVSGDLVVHGFGCRFNSLAPGSTPQAYSKFVEKTLRYVVAELHHTLPAIPVYLALGNNDSGCADYQLDANGDFLAATSQLMIDGLAPPAPRQAALADYTATGSFSLTMPAPMLHTRLIVLDDLFQSRKYAACGGKPDPAATAAQITWLEKQLDDARLHHQRVWVMGHIPPGVNLFATFAKMRDICGGAEPEMFLSSEKLADVMGSYADVIKLAIFGHSHMDELRLFGAKDDAPPTQRVAFKVVSSISPVDGNKPTFTVATINPTTAELLDYTVWIASNPLSTITDSALTWAPEYRYSSVYHQSSFTPPALDALLTSFKADPTASSDASKAYIGNYVAGDNTSLLKPLWPQYVCAQTHNTAKGFAACMCPATH